MDILLSTVPHWQQCWWGKTPKSGRTWGDLNLKDIFYMKDFLHEHASWRFRSIWQR
jgi:hypothetical protein